MLVLQKKLCDQHMMRLTVKWQEGGLSTDNAEHAQYVAEVTTSLTKQLTSTILTIIEEDQNKVGPTSEETVFQECKNFLNGATKKTVWYEYINS